MPRSPRRPRDRALYVETLIRAPMERVWELTQDPELHARWDARFSAIVPLRVRADGAAEFRYELRVGPWTIRGTGVSLGERRGRGGERTSALVFESGSALSPLASGRGYWRYVPTDEGVRFCTGYDYAPGWGILGRVLDPLLTRRLVWRLTAWSFDRLRLWAEDGVEPERVRPWRGWRPGGLRARARNCRSRPERRTGRTIMQGAPEALGRIGRR
ncbi:SRPBCC family protein [Leucobacter sp. CSA1]|uniref:SRPBCC family protein n=1 Tax=Leucobacter chromiisoli TaxID=2796471 RepID=A0A934UUT5_9MICO|nr:SRPBCC family protein [Leucobacter chromiisoli]MBK0418518.1 SRPBCC family protein [Leucobacter chromiisoli]